MPGVDSATWTKGNAYMSEEETHARVPQTGAKSEGLHKRPFRQPMASVMRQESVYSVECVCGRQIETERQALPCPYCQRDVVIEWPAEERPQTPEPVALSASEPA